MKKYALSFFLSIFIIGTDNLLIAPLLPILVGNYRISIAVSGWMLSAYALGYALFALLAGPLSEGKNRKKIILAGFAGFALSTLLCAFAPNFASMIIFRLIAGISASFIMPQIYASVPSVAEGHDQVRLLGIIGAGVSVSTIAGVPLGSLLAGMSWQIPFLVLAAAALIMLGVLIFILPDIQAPRAEQSGFFAGYIEIFRQTKTRLYFLALLIFFIGTYSLVSFTGTWFAKDFGLQVGYVGIALSVLGIGQFFGSLLAARLSKVFGSHRLLWLVILLLALTFIGLPFSDNLPIALLVNFAFYFLAGLQFPQWMTLIQASLPRALGTTASLFSALIYLASTIAGVSGGVLFDHFSGYFRVSFFAAILALIACSIVYFAGKKKSVSF